MNEPLLNATEEAALMGLRLPWVARCRKDAAHPANSVLAVRQGRSTLVPTTAVRTYWASRSTRRGPAPTQPWRLAGLTPGQWTALQNVAAGRLLRPGMHPERRRLTELGLIADGQVTEQGRSLIDQYATTPQEI